MAASRSARPFALGLCVLLASAAGLPAQRIEGCPWLNAATAGGVLGGEVRMSVTNTAKANVELPDGAIPDATCEFTLLHSPSPATLRIVVRTTQDRAKEYAALVAACGPSPRRVVGVGNEAVGCSLKKGTLGIEQIVARVRQRTFVLSVSRPGSEAASGSEEAETALSKLQNTAEQIAGSLF